MATFVKHTACPVCGSSDALAHYSDGSSYCYSHGKPVSHSDKPGFIVVDEEGPEWSLPHDLSTDNFPIEFFQWLEPTGLKLGELLAHNYFFSKSTGRVWRIFQQSVGPGLRTNMGGRWNAAENRSLYGNQSKVQGVVRGPKARFYGSKEETFAYSGSDKLQLRNSLVIVEDSLSSIKVGRHCCSIPLFGSSIGNSKLAAICKNGYESIYVWLDSDKLRAAHSIAERLAMLGIKSSVVLTDDDPKYISDKEIECLIG